MWIIALSLSLSRFRSLSLSLLCFSPLSLLGVIPLCSEMHARSLCFQEHFASFVSQKVHIAHLREDYHKKTEDSIQIHQTQRKNKLHMGQHYILNLISN